MSFKRFFYFKSLGLSAVLTPNNQKLLFDTKIVGLDERKAFAASLPLIDIGSHRMDLMFQ